MTQSSRNRVLRRAEAKAFAVFQLSLQRMRDRIKMITAPYYAPTVPWLFYGQRSDLGPPHEAGGLGYRNFVCGTPENQVLYWWDDSSAGWIKDPMRYVREHL